ncbi:hypothetical protein F2P81_007212 [Scophthalmus maximus]|uniref:Low-density lipoprotein receptor class A domain-containing protein 3 n=1 Tax=Scophthalmus maximus TaxID=52904 RepID=A0A6A4TDP6_SCOMX|nr:hypothetical protein F2P81_007212 [Scophthalmus maximus]
MYEQSISVSAARLFSGKRLRLLAEYQRKSQLLPGNNFTTECNIPGNFMCGDGKCVPGGWQCDGLPDCFDKSDEKGCPKVKSKCAPTFFACANGVHCIIGRFRCNGFSDCPDGSDEENCTGNPLVCSESRFKCRNGRCVDRSFLCNGQDNCQDNSDEELCLTTAGYNDDRAVEIFFHSHHSLSLFHILLHHSSFIFLFISSLSPAEAPGQDFVTLDYRLRYYPSITYAVIGSAVIFVLVVALLALVLHHQRKRSVLLPRGVRGGSHHHHHHHQPLLLSRLVILDRGHVHPGGPGLSPGSPTAAGQYSSTTQALQLLSGTLYPSGLSMDSPPSYSQAVLDVRTEAPGCRGSPEAGDSPRQRPAEDIQRALGDSTAFLTFFPHIVRRTEALDQDQLLLLGLIRPPPSQTLSGLSSSPDEKMMGHGHYGELALLAPVLRGLALFNSDVQTDSLRAVWTTGQSRARPRAKSPEPRPRLRYSHS